MKKLLLIFIFTTSPLLLISQTISFDDIKMINSKESFDRFVIENNFESWKSIRHYKKDDDGVEIEVGYGHNLVQGNEAIQASYQDNRVIGGDFEMQFNFIIGLYQDGEELNATNDYKFILNQVKNQCKFYKISTIKETYDTGLSSEKSYSCYTCPSSKYPGKICFVKGEIIINNSFLN